MTITWTNIHGIPEAIASAIVNDEKRSLGRYSITQLLAPPRIRRLLETHDVTEDVSSRVWAMLGKGAHAVLQRESERGAEIEIAARIDGVWISGTIDLYEGGVLRDWKMTSTYASAGREGWEQQLNSYAWLLAHGALARSREANGKIGLRSHTPQDAQRLEATMIFRDWSGGRAKQADYPPCPVQTIEFPRWQDDVVERFLRERLALHLAANAHHGTDVAICTDAERWRRDDKFAVMKEKRKSAVRVFGSEADARAFAEHQNLPGLSIQHRPGTDVRCESYCPARTVCPHGMAIAARNTNTKTQSSPTIEQEE